MNYQPGLTVCTILKTIASNYRNHLGDIYNLEMPSILSFLMLLVKTNSSKTFGKKRQNFFPKEKMTKSMAFPNCKCLLSDYFCRKF